MGLIRLGVCLALDTVLTVASGGIWIAASSCEMGGCFTAKEMRFQREKEALREAAKIIGEEKRNGTKKSYR